MPHHVQTPPLRVAFCIDNFEIGGTELNAVRTAEALDPSRCALTVFHFGRYGPLRPRYEELGLRLIHVPIRNLYSPATVRQVLRVASFLRRERVTVVHAHDVYSNIFFAVSGRVAGCPVITSRRWAQEVPRPGLRRLNAFAHKISHRVLANSASVARLVASEGVLPRNIVEVPNFLDEKAFRRYSDGEIAAKRRQLGIPEDAFLVGMVARLAPVKNHALLLTAIAELPADTHVALIGDGPERPTLERLVMELGLGNRVHFVGAVLDSENLHAPFDVSVLCSNDEGFPNTVIEALAGGRPVVATRVGGVSDVLVHGDNGLVIERGDVHALAKSLRALRESEALRHALGESGRRSVRERFAQAAVVGRLEALYFEAASASALGTGSFTGDGTIGRDAA